MTYRVAQWSTGNVGKHALAGIAARPDLELTGCWVSDPAKAGRDAGELAGLDTRFGVTATTDAEAVLATRPDCVVYTAMADDRIMEALADLRRILKAGCNVVSSSPVFLQFPEGVIPPELSDPVREAAKEGGVSLWVNGIDPGFANDWLPLTLTSIAERVDELRCLEILDYSTYDNRKVLFDIMGFGSAMDDLPLLLQPGVLTLAWGSVVRQLAAGLGTELDEVTEHYERLPAPDTFDIAAGTIDKGTAAALRFEIIGMRGGKPACVLEHITRLRPDIGPDWQQPTGNGCYRVQLTGEPNYTLDLQLMGSDGDHNTAGLKATAMRLVNAVPAVVEASPGLLTGLDLPLVTGRGLLGR
ncbi:diacylglycerol kinase [Prauserella marina]|uniref:4-hydroxy-tetrahydrodipicolinate reductase n=1 Tax=Prauserella marina TaxID=530584 RepID=A0A222VUF5_9PSEU|nr:diacylglycerol kinase [Prauserella marina]ASR37545.1 diacylglycerol kinase [Prauserella marina]PWV75445.1 4-hydroxy-tetrahydrodipicolinate reductase [Prauserella marina]SDD34398.1 4-hydroxy-tetrahydrodipicolinate reductase [Prauserella marina]